MSEAPADRRWDPVTECGPFSDHAGLFYQTRDALDPAEDMRLGFRVAPHHCNLRPHCHSGMLSSFLDIALARGLRVVGGIAPPLPTISLSIDFMAPALLGAWIDAWVRLGRIGKSTAFATALVYADDMLIARSNGISRHFTVAVRDT